MGKKKKLKLALNKARPDFWTMVTVAAIIFFGMFLVYPVGRMFYFAFQSKESEGATLDNFIKFFSRPYYLRTLFNSLKVTLLATILVVLIGVPLAYIMTRFTIRGHKIINILIIVSMFSPPFIGAYSWVLMLGRNGIITNFFRNTFGIEMPNIYGFNGILLVFTLKLFPYIYMYTKGALRKIDASLEEASESLGYHGIQKITKISLPLITPTILSGATVVFLRAFADYGTPRLIGEGYPTMPVIIYNEWLSETGSNAFFASSVAFIMMAIAASVFALQTWLSNRKSYKMSLLNPLRPRKIKGIGNFFAHFYAYFITLLAVMPTIYIIVLSFKNMSGSIMQPGFGLENYRLAFSKAGAAILNTFRFGIIAILVVVVFGTLFSYVTVRRRNPFTRILDVFIMFPYVIPGTIFGLILLMSYNSGPLVLTGGSLILIISYIIRRMPYTVRSASAMLHQISPSIEEASMSLGYSAGPTFMKVTVPAMASGIVSGAVLSWITIIQELSSTLMLYTTRTSTMSTAIFAELNRGAYGTASALATILTVTMVGSLVLFFRLTGNTDIDM